MKNDLNKNEEIINLKNELSYKNSIIKYLEEMLNNYNYKAGEDSLREEYEKKKKKIKKHMEKNKNDVNKVNNKRKLKLNEQLIIKNEESTEDLKNKEINFEFNISNKIDSTTNKEKILETEDRKNFEPLKKEIENLDEEILEIQTKLKEMLKK